MSWRLTLFLFVLILLVFLVFIFLTPGDRWRPGSLDLEVPAWQEMRARLTTKVDLADIRLVGGGRDCRMNGAQLSIPVDESCVYLIRPLSNRTTLLRLRLQPGTELLDAQLSQENALTVTEQLTPAEDELDLDIYRHEARLDAELRLGPCRVAEPDEDEDPILFCLVAVE